MITRTAAALIFAALVYYAVPLRGWGMACAIFIFLLVWMGITTIEALERLADR